MQEKIVIIGSGNVASVFAKKLFSKGIAISQILARNQTTGEQLAKEVNSNCILDWNQLQLDASCYIISVQDDALPNTIAQLKHCGIQRECLVVHTTGSASIGLLENISDNYGVLYPLQSLRKEMKQMPNIPLFIDGNNPTSQKRINALAAVISSQIAIADDAQRLQLHIAAVFVSNFPNYLYTLAESFCSQNNLPFSFLLPLMEESVQRLRQNSPNDIQTGPAARGDISTIEKHIQVLQNTENKEMLEIYNLMTKNILKHFHNKI